MTATGLPFIDSHTGGEPTRVILSGGPDLGQGSAAGKLAIFRARHDDFRRAVITEPRGSDVLVGALLLEASDPSCLAGVIFFDNACCIGMCGHGMIGLVATLAHLGKIEPGEHRIETPVGVVAVTLHEDASVAVANVYSYRKARAVAVELPGGRRVVGDVAYGGNWFFLVDEHGQTLARENVEALTNFAWQLRQAINAQGFPEVDHVILYGPTHATGAHSRNFVLCPGRAYDRSPCGTGTSARLACLAADGALAEGSTLVQESIVGSTFTGRYRWVDREGGLVTPIITGSAFITAEGVLHLDPQDPFRCGHSL
jgi:4-hydroxyproline epimerase